MLAGLGPGEPGSVDSLLECLSLVVELLKEFVSVSVDIDV
jgi:hypothetical protein